MSQAPNARQARLKSAETRIAAKTIFDGTKLPMVVGRLKTTAYGMATV
jgi:hypothetical protein